VPGLRHRPDLGVADQAVDLGVRRLPSADLGDRRHHHAPIQTATDHLVLGGLSDGDPFQQPALAKAGGISALQLQRQLALGSYKSAWLLAAKLRRSMVAPDRNPLAGLVEVDETEIACRSKHGPVSGGGGRSHQGKILVAGAVEVEDGGPGCIRLAELSDYSAGSLHPFIAGNLAPSATAKTDGWSAYPGAPASHTIRMSSARSPPTSSCPESTASLPISKSGPWASTTACAVPHLQSYLDEFVFRFNRRRTRHALALGGRGGQGGGQERHPVGARPSWRGAAAPAL
jgi:hypothetical protein